MTTGAQLRDQGVEDVLAAEAGVHRDTKETVQNIILDLAGEGVPFTAETVRSRLPAGMVPHHPNVIPAHMGSAAKRGWIVPVGMVKASRQSRHAGRMMVWQGAEHS